MSGLSGDEHVFADGVVTCVGQIIAIVLAKDKATAQRAAKKVTINYTDLPSVITIKVILSITQFYLNISSYNCLLIHIRMPLQLVSFIR